MWVIRGFQEVVQECALVDLPMEGYQFTWFKSIGRPEAKEGRLDRVLASQSSIDMFPHFKFINGLSNKSDHSPLWARLNDWERKAKVRDFKFENSWLEEPELPSIVCDSWSLGEGIDFITKVKHCTSAIDAWGKRLRSRYRDEINTCRRNIEMLRVLPGGSEDPTLIETKNRLGTLLAQEEAFWKQRAKV